MNGLSIWSATSSMGFDAQAFRGCSLPIADSTPATTQSVCLSFTYFPKSESVINAVKLTQRSVLPTDVLTLYYPPGKIFFTGLDCQEALSYSGHDMIHHDQPEHETRLHRAENPTIQTGFNSGWHCHIKVERENTANFIEALFQRHGLNSDESDTHKKQFLRSMNMLTDAPGIKGLKFPDGSYSQNQECKDMAESIPLDDTDFQFVH
ncbi:hypothetical protein [Endozoicomonas sp. ONNA2]|uniref:hypothetical protein n=1 Tax=Endozoicomonas sp. ONNA2 TaxID=2828741 RepID=UPI0021495C4E|nr:hypothetical protein [Endozoicomonas sp. ONNA2]